MTNAEKYLKAGIDFNELLDKMEISLCVPRYEVEMFWRKEIKPSLTCDERIILKNIQINGANMICRNIYGDLYLARKNSGNEGFLTCYNHLFKFIKNGKDYSIKELHD